MDVLVALVILAFTAVPAQVRAPQLHILRDAIHWHFDPVDIVANVLGYVPLGLALAAHRARRALGIAAAISIGAELTQLFSVGRDPSVVDVTTNIAGAWLGWLVAVNVCRLPEYLSLSRVTAIVFAALVVAFLSIGAGVTVEGLFDRLRPWVAVPPWVHVNSRGLYAPGALEGRWSFDAAGAVPRRSFVRRVPGVVGNAVDLDGRDGIDLGSSAALRLAGSMTLGAWVMPRAYPKDDAAVISSRSLDEFGYQLDITADQGPRTVGFKLAGPDGQVMARYGRSQISPGRWHYIAGVYDAAARTLDVYLDGQLDNGCIIGAVAGRQSPAGGHVYVGRRAGGHGFEFSGLIDEVEIHSRALTHSELQSRFARGLARTGDAANDRTGASPGRTADVQCQYLQSERHLRIAGPFFALGLCVALACAGLIPVPRYDLVALGCSLLIGATCGYWSADSWETNSRLLLAILVMAGTAATLLALRVTSPAAESDTVT